MTSSEASANINSSGSFPPTGSSSASVNKVLDSSRFRENIIEEALCAIQDSILVIGSAVGEMSKEIKDKDHEIKKLKSELAEKDKNFKILFNNINRSINEFMK